MSKTTTGKRFERFTLVKKTVDGDAVVLFTVRSGHKVTVYTFGTWTDYTTRFEMSHAEARTAWKKLIVDGFSREVDSRLACNPRKVCEAA